MDPRYAKWDELERERRAGMPDLHDPTTFPCFASARIRVETGARDTINSRAWDFFHATPPTQIDSKGLQTKGAPLHMDMNPIPARQHTGQQRSQVQYIPDPARGATKADALGVPPPASAVSLPPTSFSANPYTQRLDASGFDSRNMIRELHGAVVEDNRERQIDASRHLAERQFYDRWLPAKASADAASLQAYELLRPKQDDWRHLTK